MFLLSPRTAVASGKGGGHPSNRAPPTPNAPESIAVPADALEQPRNPSSATSDGGHAAPDNVHPDGLANDTSLSPSTIADLSSACLRHVTNILKTLRYAGAMPGSQDVLHFVKNILEHFSVNNLDEDLDCLVSAQPDQQARAEFVVDVAAALRKNNG